jgi:hypothetical protein
MVNGEGSVPRGLLSALHSLEMRSADLSGAKKF